VLAGHFLRGLPVRAFADLYPEQTAGLVLVDASHPDHGCAGRRRTQTGFIEISQRVLGWLGWFGLLRALNLCAWDLGWLPAPTGCGASGRRSVARLCRSRGCSDEVWSVSREQLNAAAPLGDLPLAVSSGQ
jgi:pimeloyl-ACP methyl ester carboxylesterase